MNAECGTHGIRIFFYNKALELGETVACYTNRSLLYKKLGRVVEAAVDLSAVLKLDPNNKTAKAELASLSSETTAEKRVENAERLLRQGGSDEEPYAKLVASAVAAYLSVIAEAPSYPNIWTKLGYARILGIQYYDEEYLDDSYNYDTVLSNLNRAIEEDEDDGDAWVYRAQVHYRCGRNDDAVQDLERGFDLDGNWTYTADEMYSIGVELPEEIVDGLREEGYIDVDEEEEDEDE